ncbi:hypothetical protein AVEN_39957-1 [Araneus ventricosus]|uniref:Uncharacterized protein n=1 Tax=Araneus ventricosus TaxID=182803 RepID=A0A4Y2JTL1_ARAVE|nr:hypothetical protein AVEN_39957-1 [Araneus ventricosus]
MFRHVEQRFIAKQSDIQNSGITAYKFYHLQGHPLSLRFRRTYGCHNYDRPSALTSELIENSSILFWINCPADVLQLCSLQSILFRDEKNSRTEPSAYYINDGVDIPNSKDAKKGSLRFKKKLGFSFF